MAIGSKKGLARLPESFKVYLVTDAVSGPGEVDSVSFCDALQILVIVCVLKSHLDCVVVHIRDRKLCCYLGEAHGFELEVRHGACCVLGQSLVDSYPYLVSWFVGPFDDVFTQNLFSQGKTHQKPPRNPLVFPFIALSAAECGYCY